MRTKRSTGAPRPSATISSPPRWRGAGTGAYSGKEDVLRKKVAVKTSAYTVAGLYTIHEMEDAIVDCKAGNPNANTDGVHAWDEAVAFYAGSLEGQAAGGNGDGEA